MYYYGYQNYAAGVIGILVLAVALTALLVVLVLPKEKDGHLPCRCFRCSMISSAPRPW